MAKPQLPNLQQTVANTILITNISNSNNLNKFWVGIFTRQGYSNQVSAKREFVSQLVSDKHSQWSDSAPQKWILAKSMHSSYSWSSHWSLSLDKSLNCSLVNVIMLKLNFSQINAFKPQLAKFLGWCFGQVIEA